LGVVKLEFGWPILTKFLNAVDNNYNRLDIHSNRDYPTKVASINSISKKNDNNNSDKNNDNNISNQEYMKRYAPAIYFGFTNDF
jgi:hypothetical protein